MRRRHPVTGLPLGMYKPHIGRMEGRWCFVASGCNYAAMGAARRHVRELHAQDIPRGQISTEYGD